MIHILFVPGSFGSMLEWAMRNYSLEYSAPTTLEMPDGSMHGFKKMCHPLSKDDLNKIKSFPNNTITTPIYPLPDYHADEIIDFFKSDEFLKDFVILIQIKDLVVAEKIMLMHYYKISLRNKSVDHFCGNSIHDIVNWNSSYQHYSEMKPWEFREWLSIRYTAWVQEWIEAKNNINENWHAISPIDLVDDYFGVLTKCLDYLGLSFKENTNADAVVKQWCLKQTKILQEHDLIMNIVNSTVSNVYLEWPMLNPISEAMIQKRLRDQGYEIKCYNLNEFPTNSSDLHNLLERI